MSPVRHQPQYDVSITIVEFSGENLKYACLNSEAVEILYTTHFEYPQW
jgi:hypothetical protein